MLFKPKFKLERKILIITRFEMGGKAVTMAFNRTVANFKMPSVGVASQKRFDNETGA